MELEPLPFRSALIDYQGQAEALLAGHRAGAAWAVEILRRCHPRFLDPEVPWLPQRLEDGAIERADLGPDDARLALARWYDFQDWPALAELVEAVAREESTVFPFESAVEAVVSGDLAALEGWLRRRPGLVRERSTRRTPFDPAVHAATLLHYIGANGVEGRRQRTPANAVAVARALLEAGAEVDALAGFYGSPCTTMSLLASSCHPAQAGVQVELIETLLDFGAAVDGVGETRWKSPLLSALTFGYADAAEALARRGARVDQLAAAAGLGRIDAAVRLLGDADAEERRCALALAAQLGQAEVLRLLLDAGEDPNLYNPEGFHAHSTPLHQAALAGRGTVVTLLLERGARLDIRDKIYRGTPLDWALHAGQSEIADLLRAQA
ncbi:MAG: ankyrin repeat domain-containing protein [Acidobacteria bacterium]|nr:ankyrin repeat domain-containing protein [Acidobacteriota bacterium]